MGLRRSVVLAGWVAYGITHLVYWLAIAPSGRAGPLFEALLFGAYFLLLGVGVLMVLLEKPSTTPLQNETIKRFGFLLHLVLNSILAAVYVYLWWSMIID